MEYFAMLLITLVIGGAVYKIRDRIMAWLNTPFRPQCSDRTVGTYDDMIQYGVTDAADRIAAFKIKRMQELKRIEREIDEAEKTENAKKSETGG